jgi:uroporphyrin-III C-methyltransferase/precorrin-2 dehydrogenase/sirohydrochlorin ferrochelatase
VSTHAIPAARATSAPTLFPIFLKLAARRVLVVGAGPVAASKIDALVNAGADVHVVAPEVRPEIVASGVVIARRPFQPSDLDGAWLVVTAASADVNREVARLADARQIFVNAVDDPPNASAYLGGIVRREGVTLAISTAGDAPALAGLLREALDAVLPSDVGRWLETARAARARWLADRVPMDARRPLLLKALNALYEGRS